MAANGGGSSTTPTPRQQITPAPYALFAEQTGGVTSNRVTTLELADASVTTPELTDGP